MAITRLPLSDQFGLVWKFDPAVDGDRFVESVAAWKALPDEEREKAPDPLTAAWLQCVERLDFAPILKEGAKPTMFYFRPVRLRELLDGGYGNLEAASLVFRMALVKVDNFDGLPDLAKKPSQDHKGLGPLVDRKVVDFLDQLCAELGLGYGQLVSELGMAVFNRLMGLSPK